MSEEAGREARAALLSLCLPHTACFRVAAGRTVGPAAHDGKESESMQRSESSSVQRSHPTPRRAPSPTGSMLHCASKHPAPLRTTALRAWMLAFYCKSLSTLALKPGNRHVGPSKGSCFCFLSPTLGGAKDWKKETSESVRWRDGIWHMQDPPNANPPRTNTITGTIRNKMKVFF